MRRPLIALSALALGALAACGGDDDATTGDTTADGTAASAASAEETATTGGAAEAGSEFCVAMDDYQTLSNSEVLASEEAPEPAVMEETFTELSERLDELESLAPDDISADVGIVAAGTRRFMDVLADADYDFDDVVTDPAFTELTAEFQSEPYVSATANVQRYASETCGLNPGPDVTAAGAPGTAATVGAETTTDD